jgi:hypothetical protein
MDISGVRPGDIIEADVKGRHFYALVSSTGRAGRKLQLNVDPITPGITWLTLTGRQVVGHWRAAGATRARCSTRNLATTGAER